MHSRRGDAAGNCEDEVVKDVTSCAHLSRMLQLHHRLKKYFTVAIVVAAHKELAVYEELLLRCGAEAVLAFLVTHFGQLAAALARGSRRFHGPTISSGKTSPVALVTSSPAVAEPSRRSAA